MSEFDSIEVIGEDRVREMLGGVAARAVAPEPAWLEAIRMFETFTGRRFARAGGKYVKTGRLEASLTTSGGSDAIRRMDGDILEFGSSVWYAVFQTQKIGPPTGNRGGMKRSGKSMVLRLTPAMSRRAGALVASYISGEVVL